MRGARGLGLSHLWGSGFGFKRVSEFWESAVAVVEGSHAWSQWDRPRTGVQLQAAVWIRMCYHGSAGRSWSD